MDNAFNACSTGIRKAQDQCLSVMGALGTVYHHARDVLDRINPDRWSSKQQPQQPQLHRHQQHIKKRQVIFKDGRYERVFFIVGLLLYISFLFLAAKI